MYKGLFVTRSEPARGLLSFPVGIGVPPCKARHGQRTGAPCAARDGAGSGVAGPCYECRCNEPATELR